MFATIKSMKEREIQFSSTQDGVDLKGTIAIPDGAVKGHVLLISGSGKLDRDETMPADRTVTGKPEKLFKQISNSLVQEGFATFRYDKRGVLGLTGNVDRKIWASADRTHLVSDAVDAAKLFCKQQQIQPKELIILGHSEGTIIGVECAIALGSKIKGLILLGAIARSFRELIEYQITESPHRPEENKAATQGDVDSAISDILGSQDIFHPDDDKPMSYYREMLSAPANAQRIKQVLAPIAIFQGKKDFLTPVDEIEKFKQADVIVHTARIYDDLGHAFSKELNGKPTLGPIEEYVLQDIVATITSFSKLYQ